MIDYRDYPDNWKEIRAEILRRAGQRCECEGECGLHRDSVDVRRCIEIHGSPAKFAKGTIFLTIAHLWQGPCKCDHKCGNLDHVKALCQRCHLRYDTKQHMKNAAETRKRKKMAVQPDLFEEMP